MAQSCYKRYFDISTESLDLGSVWTTSTTDYFSTTKATTSTTTSTTTTTTTTTTTEVEKCPVDCGDGDCILEKSYDLTQWKCECFEDYVYDYYGRTCKIATTILITTTTEITTATTEMTTTKTTTDEPEEICSLNCTNGECVRINEWADEYCICDENFELHGETECKPIIKWRMVYEFVFC